MHLYLSPHHDDVCFSIGNLASRMGGDVLNLFTVSRYVAVDPGLPADEAARVEAVSGLRRLEDEAFVKAAGLSHRGLGFREPRLTGHEPFDLANLAPEVDMLLAKLMPVVLGMLPHDGDPSQASLYCPMGIGGHRNHISTFLAVRAAYDVLRHRCTVFLYEDLHYASVSRLREDGLQRAAHVFADYRLSPVVHPLGPDEAERKMQWIGLYASQHPQPPRSPDFTPASGLGEGLHEIVWRVSPLDGGQA